MINITIFAWTVVNTFVLGNMIPLFDYFFPLNGLLIDEQKIMIVVVSVLTFINIVALFAIFGRKKISVVNVIINIIVGSIVAEVLNFLLIKSIYFWTSPKMSTILSRLCYNSNIISRISIFIKITIFAFFVKGLVYIIKRIFFKK